MLRSLMRRVLGGKSNKREAALFMFLICAAWVTALIVGVFIDVDVSAVTGLVSAVTLASVGGVIGTTITHHMRPPAQSQEDEE